MEHRDGADTPLTWSGTAGAEREQLTALLKLRRQQKLRDTRAQDMLAEIERLQEEGRGYADEAKRWEEEAERTREEIAAVQGGAEVAFCSSPFSFLLFFLSFALFLSGAEIAWTVCVVVQRSVCQSERECVIECV
eukprot:2528278-Rhodomonas_salina.2